MGWLYIIQVLLTKALRVFRELLNPPLVKDGVSKVLFFRFLIILTLPPIRGVEKGEILKPQIPITMYFFRIHVTDFKYEI
jgi:hypothetical protein